VTDDYSDMSDEELVDAMGMTFAQGCASVGAVGFAIRLLDSGDVRVIGMSLPPHVVAEMLRDAADAYEDRAPRETLN
jgi:hypothetical protein